MLRLRKSATSFQRRKTSFTRKLQVRKEPVFPIWHQELTITRSGLPFLKRADIELRELLGSLMTLFLIMESIPISITKQVRVRLTFLTSRENPMCFSTSFIWEGGHWTILLWLSKPQICRMYLKR